MFLVKFYENFILFIKVAIIILLIYEIYYHFTNRDNDIKNKKIKYWEGRLSFLFNFLVALLILYLFLPDTNRKIDNSMKFTLFLFGIVLIIKSDFVSFVKDSILFKAIYGKPNK